MSVTLQATELREWRKARRLSQDELAHMLGTAREWLNKIENGRAPVSADIQLRFEAIKRNSDFTSHAVEEEGNDHLKKGRLSTPDGRLPIDKLGPVAPRFTPEQRAPSSREDCEAYFQTYLDRAQSACERDNDPDVFPEIMRRMKKYFRPEEFDHPQNE